MSPELLLFLLRILGALLLLVFFGAIGWLLYRDLQIRTTVQAESQRRLGSLRLIQPSQTEPAAEQLFPLTALTTIGRSTTNTVILEDEYVSSRHALLAIRGSQWWLEDLESRNGTYLNGAILTEATVVSAGDVIGIGSLELKLEPN